MHGGKSTGPRTPEGKARSIAAQTKHGRRSKANVEKVREINSEVKRTTYELKRAKFIPYRWDLLLRVCSKNRTAR